ncbi:hypothetical protein SAMN04487864_10544 [Succiniclasticum ruminis]|uniref:HNH endonuclease n=1 Tax=Succiniclasticum ruminis TaxID=40841 RepID=A0A1G6KQD0_9FIRM|nr:HNH endonuclease signature motif containing protein [Succiniclasticum ruminis]SDC33299.1 hypothetical protein SAMN04487864_10544 [Succiniclasticum ruminis]
MSANDIGVNALIAACKALTENNVEEGKNIIQEKYPHQKPLKSRKSFTKKEQVTIFLRDGFIDRYSGDRLIFPGVLCILSHIMPDVFPYQDNWKTDECHQAWWKLFPSIDHIVPLAFGGTNDDDNLVCTSMKRNLAKSTSTLEEIGWNIHPAGNLSEWDGLLSWFMAYIPEHPELLEDVAIRRWFETCQALKVEKHLKK